MAGKPLFFDERWGQRGTAGSAIPKSLSFAGVSHAYGGKPAVNDISLAIAPGEVIGLLGPSGCGKSTLLRLAAGLERPAGGAVAIDGIEVAGKGRFVEPEHRGVGMVFQDFALFPHLSVLDNVRFGLRALAARDADDVALRALDRVGLGHYAKAFPQDLSGGEQQRVALARAIAPRPGILLLDEPFSGLDQRLRDAVRDETLAVLRETRATTIIVTHEPEEALRMVDRIVLMREGRIVQAGTPDDLYNHPVDLDALRFFCDVNIVEGKVRGGRLETPLGPFDAPGLDDGATGIAAIRPQAVVLSSGGQGVPGRLLRRRFLGEVDLMEIAVAGLDVPLTARMRQREGLNPGRDVTIHIVSSGVLVFAAPGA